MVAKKQAMGTLGEGELFSFEINFQPNQNDFPQDLYSDSFKKVAELAATYGGAIITVEGHSDPHKYQRMERQNAAPIELRRTKQAAKNLSMNRAIAVRDSIIGFAENRGVPLDPSQFTVVGHGIDQPKYPEPKTKEQWLSNMRVVFRIIQIEAEETAFRTVELTKRLQGRTPMFGSVGWMGGWAAALLTCFLLGCGEEPPAGTQNPSPPIAKEQPPPEPDTPETAPQPSGTWPYVTQDYQVALADDLLGKNVVLVFDGSGSMEKVECSGNLTKCEAAKQAVLQWSATLVPEANLGLVTFHADSQGIAAQPLSAGNRDGFIQTVRSIAPGGKTPLTQALKKAFELMERQAQRQLGYGQYTIVVVTDGIANDPESLTRVVNALLAFTPIDMYTIGFCIGTDHSLNQPGRTHYRAADNPDQLREGLREALAETQAFDATEFN